MNMERKLTIKEVNNLSQEEFMKIFGNIVESYPVIANTLYKHIPFKNTHHILVIVLEALENLKPAERRKVLQLHPPITGVNLPSQNLTEESAQEQAYLFQSIPIKSEKRTADYAKFLTKLHEKYYNKFGFPLVICARQNTTSTLRVTYFERYNNDEEQEVMNGMAEVKKICKLRLHDILEL